MRATAADRLRGEDGSALVPVVLISFLLMGLVAMTLGTGDRANTTSARDRNADIALAIAESGVQEGIAKVQASSGTYTGSFTGTTPEGGYDVVVTRSGDRFVIEASGASGSASLERRRRVRVTLAPPGSFNHALFSETSIELKNNDTVRGDVWANDSVLVSNNDRVTGSVTAAGGWIDIGEQAVIEKNVWSGGFSPSGPWAIRLAVNADVQGSAKASVTAPTDPATCGGETQADYEVVLAGGSTIDGNLTTWGVASDPSRVLGTYSPNTCTAAAIPVALPSFSFNANNYDSSTYHEFGSVSAFQSWLDTGSHKTNLHGTFYVAEASPSQTDRINLTGAIITGDTTIVTPAPVFTGGIDDNVSSDTIFVIVSSYQPPTGSACDVNHDSSECAVHLKNNFDPTCETAILIYADRGPVAVKNNQAQCGSIYAESILVKNNQELTYDSRIERVIGFGSLTYTIIRWEELAAG